MSFKNINRIVYCFNYARSINLINRQNLNKSDCIIITYNTGIEKIKEKICGLRGYTVIYRENDIDYFYVNSHFDILKKL